MRLPQPFLGDIITWNFQRSKGQSIFMNSSSSLDNASVCLGSAASIWPAKRTRESLNILKKKPLPAFRSPSVGSYMQENESRLHGSGNRAPDGIVQPLVPPFRMDLPSATGDHRDSPSCSVGAPRPDRRTLSCRIGLLPARRHFLYGVPPGANLFVKNPAIPL